MQNNMRLILDNRFSGVGSISDLTKKEAAMPLSDDLYKKLLQDITILEDSIKSEEAQMTTRTSDTSEEELFLKKVEWAVEEMKNTLLKSIQQDNDTLVE